MWGMIYPLWHRKRLRLIHSSSGVVLPTRLYSKSGGKFRKRGAKKWIGDGVGFRSSSKASVRFLLARSASALVCATTASHARIVAVFGHNMMQGSHDDDRGDEDIFVVAQ